MSPAPGTPSPDDRASAAQPVAVWYFVAATFVAALPNLLFPDLPLWARIAGIVLALVLIALGGARLAKEVGAAKAKRTDDPEPDPRDGDA